MWRQIWQANDPTLADPWSSCKMRRSHNSSIRSGYEFLSGVVHGQEKLTNLTIVFEWCLIVDTFELFFFYCNDPAWIKREHIKHYKLQDIHYTTVPYTDQKGLFYGRTKQP